MNRLVPRLIHKFLNTKYTLAENKIYNKDLALIGAGYWGKNLARNFNDLGALHTICDSSFEAVTRFSNDLKSVNGVTNTGELWSNSEITRVAIAAPAVLHYQLAKNALEADKDVFVEKPLCLNVEEGQELVAIAKARNKVLMVGHLLQYHPCVKEIQSLLSDGKLGKLQYISSNRLNFGKIRKEENALWSFAPHDLSVILSLAGNILPEKVQCFGGDYLTPGVVDTTMMTMRFPEKIRAHVYVSWLNPFKEQKLTAIGTEGMLVFDDTKPWREKLTFYKDHLTWEEGQIPVPNKSIGEFLEIKEEEPLKLECAHFLDCCDKRKTPKTDGIEGLRVLTLLNLAQKSLESSDAEKVSNTGSDIKPKVANFHPTAVIDAGAEIGEGTKVWHFAHICGRTKIGKNCVFGQNTLVAEGVSIGNNVKVQNNVAVYSGVTIEDDVFLGPSCVLTNVSNPRSQVNRKEIYEKTLIQKGATVGANATIIPGVTLGMYSFISAGAVVTGDVPDYALVRGMPARQVGWMSRHGHQLKMNENGMAQCSESGLVYKLLESGVLRCETVSENSALPEKMSIGKKTYRDFKNQ